MNQQKLNQALAMYHSQRMTVREIEEATGVSASTIYRAVKKDKNFLANQLEVSIDSVK